MSILQPEIIYFLFISIFLNTNKHLIVYYNINEHGCGLVDACSSVGIKAPLCRLIITNDFYYEGAKDLVTLLMIPANTTSIWKRNFFMKIIKTVMFYPLKVARKKAFPPCRHVQTKRRMCSCALCSCAMCMYVSLTSHGTMYKYNCWV